MTTTETPRHPTKRGRPRDPNAVRAPSGAKSRSRKAKLVEALNTHTAQTRIKHNRALGMSAQAAVEAALDPRAATRTERLWQLGLISAKHRRAAKMLADALPPAPLRTQSMQFDDRMRYGMRIDCGGMVASHVDPSAEDEITAKNGPAHRDASVSGGTTFHGLMVEFLAHGLTPHLTASIAREAVIEEHGNDAWQLVLAVVSGTALPANATKARLRAALNTVSATLGTEFWVPGRGYSARNAPT
jgi:hypothetical protein